MIALICLAGLSALPSEPFEAALVDGASPWRVFWHITLPLMRSTLVVAALFRTIDALKCALDLCDCGRRPMETKP